MSSVILYTPASSAFDEPTSTFLSVRIGSCPSTWDRSEGLNFDAQPAQLDISVSLIDTLPPFLWHYRGLFPGYVPFFVTGQHAGAESCEALSRVRLSHAEGARLRRAPCPRTSCPG